MSVLSAVMALLKVLAIAFGWKQQEQAKADGAAIQRETDLRAENEKIAKADIAGDAVANGGGVPVDQDPFNRDR